jgi:hypothetical protein
VKLTRRRKINGRLNLQVDIYKLVSRAVESGIASGLRRAHKHTDTPGQEEIKWAIENAVMNELSEVFLWPDVYKD